MHMYRKTLVYASIDAVFCYLINPGKLSNNALNLFMLRKFHWVMLQNLGSVFRWSGYTLLWVQTFALSCQPSHSWTNSFRILRSYPSSLTPNAQETIHSKPTNITGNSGWRTIATTVLFHKTWYDIGKASFGKLAVTPTLVKVVASLLASGSVL